MTRASLLLMESPPGDDEADSKHTIIKLANGEFLAHLMRFHLVPDIESTSTATQVDNKVAIEMNNLQEFGTQCKAQTKDVGVGTSNKETATIATQTDQVQVHSCETAPRAINHKNLKTVEITQNLHEPLCGKMEKSMHEQPKSRIISKFVEKDEKQRNNKSIKHHSRTKEKYEGQNSPKYKEQSRKLPRSYSTHNLYRVDRFNRHGERIIRRHYSPTSKRRRTSEKDRDSTLSRNHQLPSTRKRVYSLDEDRRQESADRRQTRKIHKSQSEEHQKIKEDTSPKVCLRNKRSVSIKINSTVPLVKCSPELITEGKTEYKSEDTTVNIKPDMSHIRCKIKDLLEDKNKSETPSSPDNKPFKNETKKSLLNEEDNDTNETICSSTAQGVVTTIKSNEENVFEDMKDVNITEDTISRNSESHGIINRIADANENEIIKMSSEILNDSKPHVPNPRQNLHTEDGQNTITNLELQSHKHITQPIVTGHGNEEKFPVSKDKLVLDVKEDGEISDTEVEMYEAPIQKQMRPHRSPHKKLTQSFLNKCKANLSSSSVDSQQSTRLNAHYFHEEHSFKYHNWNDHKRNEILLPNPPLYPSARIRCDTERRPFQYDPRPHINYRHPSQYQTPLKYGIF